METAMNSTVPLLDTVAFNQGPGACLKALPRNTPVFAYIHAETRYSFLVTDEMEVFITTEAGFRCPDIALTRLVRAAAWALARSPVHKSNARKHKAN